MSDKFSAFRVLETSQGLQEHELIRRYKPVPIGIGGEHVVYRLEPEIDAKTKFEKHRKVVVKVSLKSIKKSVLISKPLRNPSEDATKNRQNLVFEWDLSKIGIADEKDFNDAIKRKLDSDKKSFLEFRSYFDRDQVPNQVTKIARVPVTREILEKVFDGQVPDGVESGDYFVILTVQEIVPQLLSTDLDYLEIVSNYPEEPGEEDKKKPEWYDNVTNYLVFSIGEEERTDISVPDSLDTQIKKSLNGLTKILETAEQDSSFADALRVFLSSCIDYSNKTKKILDVLGSKNILFFKEGKNWKCKLVDAYHNNSWGLGDVEMAFQKMALNIDLDHNDKAHILNAFNYIRTINGLAKLLGIPERISLNTPDAINLQEIDFWNLLRT